MHGDGRRLHFGRYITFQTKLNGSECESTMCACRVGGQGACVCLSKPPYPHPSYLTVLSAHRSNNVCRHRINISSIKSSKHASVLLCCSSWQTAAWVHAASHGSCTRETCFTVCCQGCTGNQTSPCKFWMQMRSRLPNSRFVRERTPDFSLAGC